MFVMFLQIVRYIFQKKNCVGLKDEDERQEKAINLIYTQKNWKKANISVPALVIFFAGIITL